MSVFIIAEAGINGDGIYKRNFDLIDQAQECFASAVKFQLYSVDSLFPDKQIIVNNINYYEIVKKCEFDFKQAKELFEYGEKIGFEVFFSVFDTERVKWCEEIGVAKYKVGAKGINNKELSEELRKTGKPIMVSFPYGKISEEQTAMWSPCEWMYCIPEYPTDLNNMHLRRYNSKFNGLSEHSTSIIPPLIAVVKEARIIEKHLTLSRKHGLGPDHSSSLEPKEFKEMVLKIREIEKCL